MVDHRISVHHDRHDIAVSRTTHANAAAIGQIADTLQVKGKLVDAMGTGEERDTDGARGIHGNSGRGERGLIVARRFATIGNS